MSDLFPAQDARGGEAPHGLRITALIAVTIGVLALAAAAFVLSYPGIHALARQTGVSRSLARVYPLIIDAMLVVACAAVLSMRGAGLVSRVFAWLSLLALLAAAAVADALHATAARLPARPAAAVVAILPWALVLIAFGLLTAMLRHARTRRLMTAADGDAARRAGAGGELAAAAEGESRARWEASQGWAPAQPAMAALPAALPAAGSDSPAYGGADAGTAPAGGAPAGGAPESAQQADPEIAADARARGSSPAAATVPAAQLAGDASWDRESDAADEQAAYQHGSIADLDVDAEPGLDDPSSDEGGPAMTPTGPWVTGDPHHDSASYEQAGGDDSEPVIALSPAPAADEPAPEPGQPVFHRVRSLPTPPAEE